MMQKGERICPCCGEKLDLVGDVLGSRIHDQMSPKFTYSYVYSNKFEKDKLFEFPGIPMYCIKCGVQLELKDNPIFLLSIIIGLVILFGLIFLLLFPQGIWYLFAASAVVLAADGLAFYLRMRWVKRWRSNFEIIDEPVLTDWNTQKLIINDDKSILLRRVLYPSNMLSADSSGGRIYLYLMNVTLSDGKYLAECRICGHEREAALFSQNMISGGRVSLWFEGRYICDAENA